MDSPPGYGRGRWPDYGGPGYGYYPGDVSSSSVSSSGDRSSQLPLWALILIMLASGLVTLVFLWLCMLFICRKRRARLAAVRDLEVQTAWAAERDDVNAPTSVYGEKDVELKHCEANHVELTYVVMAGEDQPSFLARPATNEAPRDDDAREEKAPPTTKEEPLSSPPPVDEDVPVNRQKAPPSPSR